MPDKPLPIPQWICAKHDRASIVFHSFRVLHDIPAQPSAYTLYCILPLQYPQKLDSLSLTFGGQVKHTNLSRIFSFSEKLTYAHALKEEYCSLYSGTLKTFAAAFSICSITKHGKADEQRQPEIFL